jgi:glycosyltransferase involved in cell wall biosynthesis
MKELVEISIVIPIFNSEKTLLILVESLELLFKDLSVTYEIILVDDSSQDASWNKIVSIANESKLVKGIHLSENKGQFIATLIGIKNSSGRYIINMDDDFEHQVLEVQNLYEYLKKEQNLKIVFGWDNKKYHLKGEASRLQKIRNQFLNFIWNKYPTDSFRIFKREMVFKNKRFLVADPMLEIYLKHHINLSEVGYLNVKFGKRLEGKSGVNVLKKFLMFLKFTPYFVSFSTYFIFTFLYCALSINAYLKGALSFSSVIVQFVIISIFVWSIYFKSKCFHLNDDDIKSINL